jgi:type VI secretion system protein ImpC
VDDVALLAALGAIAGVIDAAVIAAALPETIGCESLLEQTDYRSWTSSADDDPLWKELRGADFAGRVGLALPRLLNRLPYGEDTDPVSAFEFEELGERNHDDYLWANPTVALCRLLAEGFTNEGWSMRLGGPQNIGELPAHTYTQDGEKHMQPCAEVLLPESSAEAILERGIMPIVSFRSQDMARLMRFQAISAPLASLAGPWD